MTPQVVPPKNNSPNNNLSSSLSFNSHYNLSFNSPNNGACSRLLSSSSSVCKGRARSSPTNCATLTPNLVSSSKRTNKSLTQCLQHANLSSNGSSSFKMSSEIFGLASSSSHNNSHNSPKTNLCPISKAIYNWKLIRMELSRRILII